MIAISEFELIVFDFYRLYKKKTSQQLLFLIVLSEHSHKKLSLIDIANLIGEQRSLHITEIEGLIEMGLVVHSVVDRPRRMNMFQISPFRKCSDYDVSTMIKIKKLLITVRNKHRLMSNVATLVLLAVYHRKINRQVEIAEFSGVDSITVNRVIRDLVKLGVIHHVDITGKTGSKDRGLIFGVEQ